jgi:hypothetical protein
MKQDSELKEQFRDALFVWSEKNLGTKFSSLPATQQSRQMIKFFVSEILEKLYPGLVPDDEGELESSIVDGPGDGGADFLYRTDDGQVLVIQAKYRGKDAQESAEAVGRICDFLHRLQLGSQGKQQALHKDLVELAGQIDWDEDTFRVYFITTGKSGKSVLDRVEQGLSDVPQYPDLVLDRSEFRYLDHTGLNLEWRDALKSSDFPDKKIVIPMIPDANDMPWCHFEGDNRDLYIGEVQGGVLANILQTNKAALFTMNIREYVGDSKTNKQIIETALNNPKNFEYFNNGVTAVAGRITPDLISKTLTCEKMSIINGAQTVKSLLRATTRKSEKSHKPLSSVRVLMRLMSFKYPSEVPFVSEVTRYNNTQNALKIADFRSNDEVQKDLARKFASLNLSGRNYEYKNKRSDKKKNTIAITLEDLTKALYAFRYGPDDMFGGTGKLFDISSSGLYTKIFKAPDEPLADSEFNLTAGTFLACSFVKGLWEETRKELRLKKEAMHPALERKGLIYFAIGELERQSYAKQKWDLDSDLAKLSKPNNWLNTRKSIPCVALNKAFDIACKILIQQYENSKAAQGTAFKHRNWFRNEQTLVQIRTGLDLLLELANPPRIW